VTPGNDGSATVVYVGRGPAIDPDGRFRLERVGAGSVAERAPYADCVVVEEPGGGIGALERLRGASVPTVLYDRTGDPTVAARATRLGVTEYVTDAGEGGRSTGSRRSPGVSEPAPEPQRSAGAMEALRDAVGPGSTGTADSVARLLDAGRKRFGASVGALAEIDGATYSIAAEVGGVDHGSTALSGAFCRRPMRFDEPCCLPDTAQACRRESVTGVFAGLGSYIGTTVRVGEERYGTVWFGSETPREPFSAAERQFLRLVARLVGAAIETGRRREMLRETADRRGRAIRALADAEGSLRAADSAAEIADIAAATATEIADVGINEVDLIEDGSSVASTGPGGGGRTADGSLPPGTLLIGDGSGTAGAEARSEATVQLGERGVLSVGGGTGRITPSERRRLSFLAARVESALCRLDGAADADGGASPPSEAGPPAGSADGSPDRFRSLFDTLPDPAVEVEFVDGAPVVRRVNDAFETVFGREPSEIEGRSLDETVVPDDRRQSARRLNDTIRREGHTTAEVERLTDDGRTTFLFRGFRYRDDGVTRGFAVYTEMADSSEQRQRLQVLHRVLRHNLRNEMTAIIGYAEMLGETTEKAECREYSDRVYERATDVAKLGEQVRRIQQALDVDRRRAPIDPGPLVAELAERFRDREPEATIDVSAGDHGHVFADELLKIAVENLVENAVEHHPGPATVDIEVTDAGEEWVDITVSDDGPGIPERERAVVSGDREITQLDHSVGLGLWLSRWVVRGTGGRLLFGDCDNGAEVTLRLQRTDGAEGEGPTADRPHRRPKPRE